MERSVIFLLESPPSEGEIEIKFVKGNLDFGEATGFAIDVNMFFRLTMSYKLKYFLVHNVYLMPWYKMPTYC